MIKLWTVGRRYCPLKSSHGQGARDTTSLFSDVCERQIFVDLFQTTPNSIPCCCELLNNRHCCGMNLQESVCLSYTSLENSAPRSGLAVSGSAPEKCGAIHFLTDSLQLLSQKHTAVSQ